MTLDLPPCFGPQFPHPGLAPGASRSSRPWNHRPLTRPPSAARLSVPLTLEGGRSRDTHHRQGPQLRASCLHPRLGSFTDAAAGPVAAKLAHLSEAASPAATAAVRPRTAPPPGWPRPSHRTRPQRALPPARHTHAESLAQRSASIKPRPLTCPAPSARTYRPIPEHPAPQTRPSCVTHARHTRGSLSGT